MDAIIIVKAVEDVALTVKEIVQVSAVGAVLEHVILNLSNMEVI